FGERQFETTDNQNQQHQGSQFPRAVAQREHAFHLAQQAAPGWHRFRNPEAKHAEIGFAQDEDRNGNPKLSQQNRPQVGQDVYSEKTEATDPGGASLQKEAGLTQS